ncbi:MAG: flagellar basal body P-ring formation chaperone FlgA [Bryobacteraceae bacterium]
MRRAIETAVEVEPLESKPAKLEVVEVSRYPVRDGELEIGRQSRWRRSSGGTWYVPGAVVAEGRSQPVWARVRLEFPCERWIAVSALRAGEAIRPGRVRVDARGSPDPCGVLAPEEEIVGWVARRLIGEGQTVTRSTVERPPEVRRGDRVVVESRRGNARLEMQGTAELAGKRGDRVLVRNATTGQRLAARVQGPGRVSVE